MSSKLEKDLKFMEDKLKILRINVRNLRHSIAAGNTQQIKFLEEELLKLKEMKKEYPELFL
jgi:hypothetical protein